MAGRQPVRAARGALGDRRRESRSTSASRRPPPTPPRLRPTRCGPRSLRPSRAPPPTPEPSGSCGRRVASTSSASTPTTISGSCSRPRSTSRSGSRSCPPTTAASSWSAARRVIARASTSIRSDRGDGPGSTTWPAPPGRSPRRASRSHGLRGVLVSSLPTASGLSSSAALELAAAWALADAPGGNIAPLSLARICQRAENAYVGVNCGLMDQFASACGVTGDAVLLDCRSLEFRPVALPLSTHSLVVIQYGLDAKPRRPRSTTFGGPSARRRRRRSRPRTRRSSRCAT